MIFTLKTLSNSLKKIFALVFVSMLLIGSNAGAEEMSCPADATCSHGIAMFGGVKYGKDFKHFDYVNPNAPKGGEIKFAATGAFDSLNQFVLKGVSAAGLGSIYDTLTTKSADEPFSQYGLLAKRIDVAKDRTWVGFLLRKEAKWHDGEPVTAEDIVWTFNTLMEHGHPFYKTYYRDIKEVKALSENYVKFLFKNNENRELAFIVGELPVLPKHYYEEEGNDITASTLSPPLGSGPYKIDSLEPGKWIRYRRVNDYWGKNLPVNKGQSNFDFIQHDYYRDVTVEVEALKAGEYDMRLENVSKNWANAYNILQVENGEIIKQKIDHENPSGMQGFVFNTRLDKFKDRRVREAISLAFDFEWENETLFYGAYKRSDSYFENSDFESSGLPSVEELALLEPFKESLPPEIFEKEFKVPKTSGDGMDRKNLLKARKLLKSAGWGVKEGKLINKETGLPMKIEFLLNSPVFERVMGPYILRLKKLGIDARMRTIDSAQYIKRVEQFDFDIVVHVFGQGTAPGNEQYDYWHSSRADVNGSQNLAGVKLEAVDYLVEKIAKAETLEELKTACSALDRVLLHNHYVVPNWYLGAYRLLHWNKFGKPRIQPSHSVGIDSWWSLKAEKQ